MNYHDINTQYDLVVIGGGMAGCAAATAAARGGLRVLLLEQDGSLGGAMSNSYVYPLMRYTYKTSDGKWALLNAGVFGEMLQRHREMGGVSERGWQPEIFKIMLDALLTENSVDVLFLTKMIDVVMDGRVIRAV